MVTTVPAIFCGGTGRPARAECRWSVVTLANPEHGSAPTSEIWTVGHSTRGMEEFIALLRTHGVQHLVDVRRFPASRRYPHFNRPALEQALAAHSIAYTWMESLGGRRTPLPDSPNTAWRNAAFRGYADYMDTDAFAEAFHELRQIAGAARTAVMCSEAVWWRCHRALISDLLLSRGTTVLHITGGDAPKPHPFTPAAHLLDGVLTYDPGRGKPAARLQPHSEQASLL